MINFELKKTEEPKTKVNNDGTADITIGFSTGVVGVPDDYKMVVGDKITVTVSNFLSKNGEQLNTEVIAAVNAFIANKYPAIP